MNLFRRHKNFVSVARKVREKSDRGFILADNAPAIALFSHDDVLKKWPASFVKITLAYRGLGFERLENKIRSVNLAMRMRIRNTDDFALVLEDQDVIDVLTIT